MKHKDQKNDLSQMCKIACMVVKTNYIMIIYYETEALGNLKKFIYQLK